MEEDFLFKELREILPERSLAESLTNENANILLLFEALKNIFSENDEIRKEKDLLQAEMIALADLLQRDAEKKRNVLIKEINSVLPRQKLEEMREKIKEGFFVHA